MTTRLLPALLATLVVVAYNTGCGDKDDTGGSGDGGASDGGASDGGSAGDGGSDGGSADGGSGDGGTAMVSGTIQGNVDVQFYTAGDDGEREYIGWEDTPWSTDFPFGAIFVSATQDDGGGGLYYRGDTTIMSPSVDGDAYSLTATLPTEGPVQVYATLDMHADGLLSTSEPFGIFPSEVEITDGSSTGNVDITILIDYDAAYAWYYGGGGGGGGGCETVGLSGSATLTSPWADGDVAVMLYDMGDNGPYYYDRSTPTVVGGGAEAAFSLGPCINTGNMQLLGAWDSNGNDLIDPADMWGAYISAPDTDANPIDIGASDLTDLEVQIPLGDGRSGLGVVPFVSLSGSVTYAGGSFDDLDPASVLFVSALMYRPSGDITTTDLIEYAYDQQVWTAADWAGASSLDWTLWVPGNTIVYLWAYVDEGPKPNGTVNEVGELVASAGEDSNGRLPTGESSTSGYVLDLGTGD